MWEDLEISVEWDDEKNKDNWRKHKVRFENAYSALLDPNGLTEEDFTSDYEERWRTIGMNRLHALLFIAYTIREDDDGTEIVRIISARHAEPHERETYGNRKL
jgi:uncharacterized DUF497 family protein